MYIDGFRLRELFENGKFRKWLKANAKDILNNYDRMKRSEGVGDSAIHDAVISAYRTIYFSNLRDRFAEFINTNFPEMVSTGEKMPTTAELMVEKSTDPNGIFSAYHPGILRMPMQMILRADNMEDLRGAVDEFAKRAIRYDVIFVGEYAYIEYVPRSMSKIDIPDEYWEVRKYKIEQGVHT